MPPEQSGGTLFERNAMFIHQRIVVGELTEDRNGKLDLRSAVLEKIASHIQITRPPASHRMYFDATTSAGLRINIEIEPEPEHDDGIAELAE